MSGGIAAAVDRVRERLEAAARRAGRNPAGIRLMAVSKFHPASAVAEAWDAGVRLFGENRVQEAAAKFPPAAAERPGLELHLIGTLQRNKARAAVELFSCVQSVDRTELVDELARRAAALGRTLDVLLELHTGEESKAGFPDLDSLRAAAESTLSCPALRLRGLMTVAPFTDDVAAIRASFRRLRKARDELASRYPEADLSVLSMGMTNDFETAIEEGSTLIRVGTAIFGPRPAREMAP